MRPVGEFDFLTSVHDHRVGAKASKLLQPLGVAYAKRLRPCHGKLVQIAHLQVRKAYLDALARRAISERPLFRATLGLYIAMQARLDDEWPRPQQMTERV
jgi:hypothetical protein